MIVAKWSHLFPSRTQKLSTLAATIARPGPSEDSSLPGNSDSPYRSPFFMGSLSLHWDLAHSSGSLERFRDHLSNNRVINY